MNDHELARMVERASIFRQAQLDEQYPPPHCRKALQALHQEIFNEANENKIVQLTYADGVALYMIATELTDLEHIPDTVCRLYQLEDILKSTVSNK